MQLLKHAHKPEDAYQFMLQAPQREQVNKVQEARKWCHLI